MTALADTIADWNDTRREEFARASFTVRRETEDEVLLDRNWEEFGPLVTTLEPKNSYDRDS
jgi:hypothetical protein